MSSSTNVSLQSRKGPLSRSLRGRGSSLVGLSYSQITELDSYFFGFTTVLVSGSFVPCIPQIARELETTGSVIKYVSPLCVTFGSVAESH